MKRETRFKIRLAQKHKESVELLKSFLLQEKMYKLVLRYYRTWSRVESSLPKLISERSYLFPILRRIPYDVIPEPRRQALLKAWLGISDVPYNRFRITALRQETRIRKTFVRIHTLEGTQFYRMLFGQRDSKLAAYLKIKSKYPEIECPEVIKFLRLHGVKVSISESPSDIKESK